MFPRTFEQDIAAANTGNSRRATSFNFSYGGLVGHPCKNKSLAFGPYRRSEQSYFQAEHVLVAASELIGVVGECLVFEVCCSGSLVQLRYSFNYRINLVVMF